MRKVKSKAAILKKWSTPMKIKPLKIFLEKYG